MIEPKNSTVLITGATGGIGRELAVVFAHHGYNLCITARNPQVLRSQSEDLQRTYQVRCTWQACDLSRPSAAETIFNHLQEQHLQIDILVNNAGFGNWGKFDQTELGTELEEIQLNIIAVVKLTKLFLPVMMKRRSGKILNVASTAGFVPGPYMSIYYATKAFVLSFSEALREEVKGTGVTISVLCPGETKTNFQKRASIEETNLTLKGFVMNPEIVARKAFDGLMKNKPVIIPGTRNKFLIFSTRILPRAIIRQIVRWFNKLR